MGNEILPTILGALIGLVLVFLIIRRPDLGVTFTLASLPIIDLLPKIPLFSSVVPLIGGVTLVMFLLNSKKEKTKIPLSTSIIFIFGFLFIAWMFLSNPEAAWSGKDRNWVFTFIQLLVLMFLSSRLLDTKEKYHTLMWVFAIVAVVSAFVAIQQGYIAETEQASYGSSGYTDNANAAARYFIVAMVFLTHLRSESNKPFPRLLMLVGIIITYIGVFFTISRTGIVLLFAAQALIFLSQSTGKQRLNIVILGVIGLVLIWLISENAFKLAGTILPAVSQGEDTMGLRYALWEAAIRMFKEKPVTGVGIGMYRFLVPLYSQDLPFIRGRSIWVHNTYIQILVETGFVGFILFFGMFINAFFNFLKAKFPPEDERNKLVRVWFIIFIVMLIGGLTKSDHADKLTWAVMGFSVIFANQARSLSQETKKQKTIRSSSHKILSSGRRVRIGG
jgi:O-antigen ligase